MPRSSWLIAFADLSAVLCAFFVMMLAMSDFDAPALDRIATIFGRDEGDWAGDRTVSPPAAALRRTGGDGAERRDYLAAIISRRLETADWPWQLRKLEGGVALVQTLPPGGPVVPAAMTEYLFSVGYPVRVSVAMSRADERLASTDGGYARGLTVAADVAGQLEAAGMPGPVPVAAFYGGEDAAFIIQIILDSGSEED